MIIAKTKMKKIPIENVSDMRKNEGNYQVCEVCFGKAFKNLRSK